MAFYLILNPFQRSKKFYPFYDIFIYQTNKKKDREMSMKKKKNGSTKLNLKIDFISILLKRYSIEWK